MSTTIAKNYQVGSDSTATNNFTIRQPATPDGTVRIANGNSGTTTDLVTVTSAGNVGVGTTSPLTKLHLSDAGSVFVQMTDQGDGASRIGQNGTALTFGVDTSNGATERMRIDSSGNVGIGTSSPGSTLDVVRSSVDTVAMNTPQIRAINNAAATLNQRVDIVMRWADGTYNGTGGISMVRESATARSGRLVLSSINSSGDATQALSLDSSGNLGLGVTPSAWAAPFGSGVFEFSGGAISGSTSANVVRFNLNSFYNGSNYIYKTSAHAAAYVQSSGSHQFFTAPSGTAGNAISFTQPMTLDASGNLLVGTTSAPANWNTVSPKMRVAAGGIQVGDYCLVCEDAFDTDSLCLVSDSTENICFGNYNRSTLVYTERARITSGGNLLVNRTTTDGSAVLQVATKSDYGIGIASGVTTTQYVLEFRNANGVVGTVTTSGTATAYNTSSDYRLKHDIAPMTGALARVAALKPCTYKWNVDDSAGEGFIAHELAEVVPQCVTGEKDAVNEDGSIKPQGIDTSFLVATLTAAIQELKAELDSVKTELALLKGTA